MSDMSINGFEKAQPASAGEVVGAFDAGGLRDAAAAVNASQPIGVVLDVGGAGSQIAFDAQRLTECSQDTDPSVALAGQVGSQVKIRVGKGWLLASVRNQKRDSRGNSGGILSAADFLGERFC